MKNDTFTTLADPVRVQRMLKLMWGMKLKTMEENPDSRLLPADRYLNELMMETMLKPMRDPDSAAVVSIFLPCELLQEAGLSPYNVESFSSYLSASHIEPGCIRQAESSGLSETLCSYHKIFIGAAEAGVLPKPRCIIYTSLACDANLVTFERLAKIFNVPKFAVDVPARQGEGSVKYVAYQLRELRAFLEDVTGREIDEDALKERTRRSRRTMENSARFHKLASDRYIPSELVTHLYAGMAGNFLLGTAEEEKYTEMLLKDVESAPTSGGKRLYWVHTIPFWSEAVGKALSFSGEAGIVGCDFTQFNETFLDTFDPETPFESMAKRLVCHPMNGSVMNRIDMALKNAEALNCDGAVWFCHWGCKHTLGGAQLAKKRFEEAGMPLLILDGDGCDRSHGGEGQTATRLGAFLEMLGGVEHE